jgi:hypothetical protein
MLTVVIWLEIRAVWFSFCEQCDWLLTRDATNGTSVAGNGIQGLDQSLDQDSSIYKAIMSNHVIQLALVNPKTLTGMYKF